MENNINIASEQSSIDWFMLTMDLRVDQHLPLSITEHLVLCLMGGEL